MKQVYEVSWCTHGHEMFRNDQNICLLYCCVTWSDLAKMARGHFEVKKGNDEVGTIIHEILNSASPRIYEVKYIWVCVRKRHVGGE